MCSFTKIEMSIPVAKKLKSVIRIRLLGLVDSQIQYVEASRGMCGAKK